MNNNCFAYNSSLRFSRFFWGFFVLMAFLFQSPGLVFILGVFVAAATSLKHNVAYHYHCLSLRNRFQLSDKPSVKDAKGLFRAWAIEASLLLVPSLLFVLKKYLDFAWSLVLLDSLLLLLTALIGFDFRSLIKLSSKKKSAVRKRRARRSKPKVVVPKEVIQEVKSEQSERNQ